MKLRIVVLTVPLASAAAALGGLAAAGSPAHGSPAAEAAAAELAAFRATAPAPVKSGARGVDPRAGGLEIGLGEWALLPEARAIRPGRVTFVIRNRGKYVHGFEIEIRRLDDEHGGDGEDAETEELRPGQSTRMTVDLVPGRYEIECSVSDHDERGMRGTLDVRADAPLVAPPRPAASSAVQISNFAFKPARLKTTAGSVVTWRNLDPAPHTATGKQFSSPQLGKGASYRRRFTRAGTYSYLCALHPGMRGTVVVAIGAR